MSRPLLVTDCDEVLLHMIVPWGEWLDEAHGIDLRMNGNNFAEALRYKASGEVVPGREIWRLLELFFDGEMHRQTPIRGAVDAINAIAEQADVVVLTNLMDHRQQARAAQLATHGIHARVFTNQGPKGPALQAILDEYQPARAFFIDDLAQHHGSVADLAPHVHRLHLCGEPSLAPHIDCAHKAGHAHARIDNWDEALPWLLAKLQEDQDD